MSSTYDAIAVDMIRQLYERNNFLKNGSFPPFSSVEKIVMRNAWNNWMGGDNTKRGLELFVRMFKNQPQTQAVFDFAKGNSAVQMQNSSRLLFHVTRVIRYINIVVDNLDTPEEVVPMLKQLGGRHGKCGYNVPPEYFPHLGDALMELMRAALPNFTSKGEATWRQLYTWICTQITCGQKDYAPV